MRKITSDLRENLVRNLKEEDGVISLCYDGGLHLRMLGGKKLPVRYDVGVTVPYLDGNKLEVVLGEEFKGVGLGGLRDELLLPRQGGKNKKAKGICIAVDITKLPKTVRIPFP